MTEFWAALMGAVIGGTAAIGGAYLSGTMQRKQARDEFLRVRKADAYLLVSDFVVRLRAAVQISAPGHTADLDELAERIGDDGWWLVQANVAAFASREVRSAFDELLGQRVRVRTHLENWQRVLELPPGVRTPDDVQFLDAYREAREVTIRVCESVLVQINSELAS